MSKTTYKIKTALRHIKLISQYKKYIFIGDESEVKKTKMLESISYEKLCSYPSDLLVIDYWVESTDSDADTLCVVLDR